MHAAIPCSTLEVLTQPLRRFFIHVDDNKVFVVNIRRRRDESRKIKTQMLQHITDPWQREQQTERYSDDSANRSATGILLYLADQIHAGSKAPGAPTPTASIIPAW